MSAKRLLIIGNPEEFHVGAHFARAAGKMEVDVQLIDSRHAYKGPRLLQLMNWHLRGHYPGQLREFERTVVERCRRFRPHWVLTTGIAPLSQLALAEIGQLGILRLNFLTDDPWNPAHYARWFLDALPVYDHIFSPRLANMADLHRVSRTQITYLPFAYNPEVHQPVDITPKEKDCLASDVLFAGGADPDRLPLICPLIDAGFRVALYGGYWGKNTKTKACARGHADLQTLAKAINAAKVTLCLVRRANRDGHVMRTFEVPAMGGCMLAEYTEEHCRILGPEGNTCWYFRSVTELLDKLRWLLKDAAERQRVRQNLFTHITTGLNTYTDRLKLMLE